MHNGQISRWVVFAGFAVLAVGLSLEAVAIYETYEDGEFGRSSIERSSVDRPEPMVRFLFDRTG